MILRNLKVSVKNWRAVKNSEKRWICLPVRKMPQCHSVVTLKRESKLSMTALGTNHSRSPTTTLYSLETLSFREKGSCSKMDFTLFFYELKELFNEQKSICVD